MDTRSLATRSRGMIVGTLALERHPLLWSAITSMVLFVVVGMTADWRGHVFGVCLCHAPATEPLGETTHLLLHWHESDS